MRVEEARADHLFEPGVCSFETPRRAPPVRGKNSCIWVQAADPAGWDALAVCPLTRSVRSQWFWSKHRFLWRCPSRTHRQESVQVHTDFLFPLAEVVERSEPSTHRGRVQLRWELSCRAQKRDPLRNRNGICVGVPWWWFNPTCCSCWVCVFSRCDQFEGN